MESDNDDIQRSSVFGIPRRGRKQRRMLEVNDNTTAWEIYDEQAKRLEQELIKDWNDTLNTLLIFAALYSAVLTAFIVESMSLIQEDTSGDTRDILLVISQQLANNSTPAFNSTRSPFVAPNWALRVNNCFFVSLSCSLVVALAAVLALQWVGGYDRGLNLSSVEGRALQRHFRRQGAIHWKLEHVIASLPTILFIALLLFFVGMAEWLWNIHHSVAAIVIVGASIGITFYWVTTLISMGSVEAPFRTPTTRYLPLWFGWSVQFIVSLIKFGSPKQAKNTINSFAKGVYGIGPAIRRAYRRSRSFSLFTTLLQGLKQLTIVPPLLYDKFGSTVPFEKREREAVESTKDIKLSGLFWLARSITIGPDQRRSLIIIVRELLKLPHWQNLEDPDNSAPWRAIFKELHDPLAEKKRWSDYSPEELQEAILFMRSLATVGQGLFTDPEFGDLFLSFYDGCQESASMRKILSSWKRRELETAQQEKKMERKEPGAPSTTPADGGQDAKQDISPEQNALVHGEPNTQNPTSSLPSVVLESYSYAIQNWDKCPPEFTIIILQNILNQNPSTLQLLDITTLFQPIITYLHIEFDPKLVVNPMPLQVLDLIQEIIAARLFQPPLQPLGTSRYLVGIKHQLSDGPSDEREMVLQGHGAIVEQTIARLSTIQESMISNGPRVQEILPRVLQLVQSSAWDEQSLKLRAPLLLAMADTGIDIWSEGNRVCTTKIMSKVLGTRWEFNGNNWAAWWVEFMVGLGTFIGREIERRVYDKHIRQKNPPDFDAYFAEMKLGMPLQEVDLIDSIVVKHGHRLLSASLPSISGFTDEQLKTFKEIKQPGVLLFVSVASRSSKLMSTSLPQLDGWKPKESWNGFIAFCYHHLGENTSLSIPFQRAFTAVCPLDLYSTVYNAHIGPLLQEPTQLFDYMTSPVLKGFLRFGQDMISEIMRVLEVFSEHDQFTAEFKEAGGFDWLPEMVYQNPLYLEEALSVIQQAMTNKTRTPGNSIWWLEILYNCLVSIGNAIQDQRQRRESIWSYAQQNAEALANDLRIWNRHTKHNDPASGEEGTQPKTINAPAVVAKKGPVDGTDNEKDEKVADEGSKEWKDEEWAAWQVLVDKVLEGLKRGYIRLEPAGERFTRDPDGLCTHPGRTHRYSQFEPAGERFARDPDGLCARPSPSEPCTCPPLFKIVGGRYDGERYSHDPDGICVRGEPSIHRTDHITFAYPLNAIVSPLSSA